MKTVTLQIENTLGEIIKEDNVVIESGDKLIIQVPKNATMESVHTIYENVREIMENQDVNAIVLPESVSLKVLKIK